MAHYSFSMYLYSLYSTRLLHYSTDFVHSCCKHLHMYKCVYSIDTKVVIGSCSSWLKCAGLYYNTRLNRNFNGNAF